MSESNEQQSHTTPAAYDVIFGYTLDKRSIGITVLNRNSDDTGEYETFNLGKLSEPGVIIQDLQQSITEFCAAALLRMHAKYGNQKEGFKPVFDLTPVQKSDSPRIRILGDESIKDIFGSRMEIMDLVSRDVLKFCDMRDHEEKGTNRKTEFGKFYMLKNRAVAFKNTVDPVRKTAFLNAMEQVGIEFSEAQKKLTDPVTGKEFFEKMVGEINPTYTPEEKEKLQAKLNTMVKEIRTMLTNPNSVIPEEFEKKMQAMQRFAKKYGMRPAASMEQTNAEMESDLEINNWKYWNRYMGVKGRGEPLAKKPQLNNIVEADIDISQLCHDLAVKHNTKNRYDDIIRIAAHMCSMITNYLQAQGQVADLRAIPNADMHRYMVSILARFEDMLAENKLHPGEIFLLGYVFRHACADLGLVDPESFKTKDPVAFLKAIQDSEQHDIV